MAPRNLVVYFPRPIASFFFGRGGEQPQLPPGRFAWFDVDDSERMRIGFATIRLDVALAFSRHEDERVN
jgi:hypothetical protein